MKYGNRRLTSLVTRSAWPLHSAGSNAFVCPACQIHSQGWTATSSNRRPRTHPSTRSHALSNVLLNLQSERQFSSHHRSCKPEVESPRSLTATNSDVLSFDNDKFGGYRDVRKYLREWQTKHEQETRQNAPDHIVSSRNLVLPNSLFNRDDIVQTPAEIAEEAEEAGESIQQDIPDRDIDDDGMESLVTTARRLRIGAAFMMTNQINVRPQLAVYLGDVGVQAQFFLENGSWFMDTRTQYSHYQIADFASKEEIDQIRQHLPVKPIEISRANDSQNSYVHATGPVPYEACASVIRRFKVLKSEATEFRRQHLSSLQNLWDAVAHEHDFKELSIEDLVNDHLGLEYSSMNDGSHMELLNFLLENERLTPLVSKDTYEIVVLPRSFEDAILQVTKWARGYQDAAAKAAAGTEVWQELQSNPLTPFIAKARRLISQSRQIRSPTSIGWLSPTLGDVSLAKPIDGVRDVVLQPSEESFTPHDKTILLFLWNIYMKTPSSSASRKKRNLAIGALILRAVGAYPKLELNMPMGRVFLQELGCVPPWADSYAYNASLPFAKIGLNHKARVLKERLDKYMNELRSTHGQTSGSVKLETSTGSTDTKPSTTSQNIALPDIFTDTRKDWGDLEVFCFDNISTALKDDAVSLEPAEVEGQFWFHVHIAHGSACIPIGSPITDYASFVSNNAYLSTGLESCIPRDIGLSLSLQKGSAVMTISSLMDNEGTVKDVKITAGRINNIINITPTVLKEFFPPRGNHVLHQMRVGTTKSFESSNERQAEMEAERTLLKKHLEKVTKMQELLLARWSRRQLENPDHLTAPMVPSTQVVYLVNGLGPAIDAGDGTFQRTFSPIHYRGDPGILLESEVNTHTETYDDQFSKWDLVASSMLLACESVGRWCTERSIPTFYSTYLFASTFSMGELNKLGYHDNYISPLGAESVEPCYHPLLNVQNYSRLTSPLRRWKDLLIQYQIDAYLRAEADARPGVEGSKSLSVDYPFSKEELLKYVNAESKYKALAALKRSERHHWRLLALFRAFYFKEAKLPEIWEVQIMNDVRKTARKGDENSRLGYLMPFAIPAVVSLPQEDSGTLGKFRQYQQVKIDYIDLERKMVFVTATGSPTNERTMLHVPEFAPLNKLFT